MSTAKRYLFYIAQNYSYAILRPLQKAIIARGDKVAWFLAGKEVNPAYLQVDEQQLMSVAEIKAYQPDAVFHPANVAPTFLPGINVAVFHGFDAGKLDRKGRNDHFKIRNCFDLYCTQGPNTTSVFKALEKKHQHFKVVETGWCALDRLFPIKSATAEELKNKKTILFCSTFSKKLSCAPHLFETVKRLSETGKWQWIIQFHPKMPENVVAQYKSIQNEHLTFVETDDVMPLLEQADVMVCDTSSVLMMFLLLNKPVVTFKNIDPKKYMLNIDKAEDLEASISNALAHPPELMANIADFIAQTHPYNDGKSSERVLAAVDDMLNGVNVPKKPKPLNIIRNIKMRKKLGYWQL
jgi:CDP-glycerol glycerophosphotransferase (TagB/SpsB family)